MTSAATVLSLLVVMGANNKQKEQREFIPDMGYTAEYRFQLEYELRNLPAQFSSKMNFRLE